MYLEKSFIGIDVVVHVLKKIKKQQQQQQQQNTVKRTPGVCPCLSLLLLVASFLDGQLGKTET